MSLENPESANELSSTSVQAVASAPAGAIRDVARAAADKIAAVDLEERVDTVTMRAHNSIDLVAQRLTPALRGVQTGIASAANSLATGADRLNTWQQDGMDEARTRIRTSPLTSVALAFALGVLFGGRRRR